jgi:predicted lipoprotein with Yx(FWY)xxD motif
MREQTPLDRQEVTFMKRVLILSVAVTTAVLALTACGGGGGYSSDAAPPDANAATVSTQQIGDEGAVLVDSAGQALYAADQETVAGRVLCISDDCTSFWEPLTVSDVSPTGDSLPGELGVVERADGMRQVTYDGKLLYSFNEEGAGEVTGDGFTDAFGGQEFTWHVVQSNGATGSPGGGGDTTTTPSYGY